jgi:hypothetical protein
MTGHVHSLAGHIQLNPSWNLKGNFHWTCLAPGLNISDLPDISGPWVEGYKWAVSYPFESCSSKSFSTSLVMASRAPEVIWGPLHRIPWILRGFHSPHLGFLQTLVGSSSLEVFLWVSSISRVHLRFLAMSMVCPIVVASRMSLHSLAHLD